MIRWWRALAWLLLFGLLVDSPADAARRRRPRSAPAPRVMRQAEATPPVSEVRRDGAVIALVAPAGRWTIAALWPRSDERSEAPRARETLMVAARVAADLAAEGSADSAAVEPLVRSAPDGLLVGLQLPSEGTSIEQLIQIAERLLTPPAIDAESIARQRDELVEELERYWSEPRALARAAVIGSLYPGYDGLPPSPRDLATVVENDVLATLAAIRARRCALRAIGPQGLAAALDVRHFDRLMPPPPAPRPTDQPQLPSELLIPITDTADSAVALSLGFRPRSDRESDPAAWSLLAAALDRGDGSLSQRLSTACGAAVDAGVQFDQIGVRGGALLFEAVVPNSCAEQALGVLRGTIESLRALPLRDDQVARAWARRETAIAQERSARLLDSLIYEPQAAWPPSVRSRRELRGEELTELLRPHLDKQRMVLAVAGSWSPSGTAQALRRIDPERFAPAIPGLERPITAREESAQIARAGEALAQELLLLLSEGQRRRTAPGHAARYRVVEDTPLGPVDAELRVRDARGDTTVWLERDRFLLAAGSPPSGSPSESASLRLEATGGQSSSHAIDDRVSVAALRQPAVLAEAVLDGRIGAQSALATCGEGTCPALLAERADGTSLLLLLDGRTRLPIGLHVWWPGSDHSAGPDEEVSYRAWSEVGEVRIASSLDIADARGGHRQLTLLAWDWMPTP